MEAISVPPSRRRSPAAVEIAAATGLGPLLLGALLIAGAYAAFAGGAVAIPQESYLQIGIAAIGLVAGLGLAAGGLRAGRVPMAWAGVALLAGFALWSALSVVWSAAPDLSWIAANRAFAYAAVAAIAIAAASSSRDAPSLIAIGFAAVSLLIAFYGLGGKVVPELHLAGLSLDPGSEFSRLRAPIGYWNAEGLLCVMTTPFCIWLAAARTPAPPVRIAALLILTVLLVTVALTYSRGAILAYAAVLAVMAGAGPDRARRLAVGLIAIAAALPSIVVAFGRADLSSGGVPLSGRAHGGAILGAVLVVSLLALGLTARELLKLEGRIAWTPGRARLLRRAAVAAVALVLLGGCTALAVSGRGPTGEISHQISQFTKPKGRTANTPDRLISSNGSNRWIWWQEALGAFSDKPLAGWGAGSFPVVRNLYRRYFAPVRSTHSLPLQLLSETGLLGALLGIGGLGLLGAAAVRGVRGASGAERSARLALLAVAAAWAVHSLVDWDWEIPALTLPALIAVAVAAAPMPGRTGPPRRLPVPALIAVGVSLAAVVLAVSAALPALSQNQRLNALEAGGGGAALARAASDAELSHKLDPVDIHPLLVGATIAQARGDYRRAAQLLVEATRTAPEDFEGWRQLSTLEAGLGDYVAAGRALQRWADTNPLSFETASTPSLLFGLEAPPQRSPTALGTPPP